MVSEEESLETLGGKKLADPLPLGDKQERLPHVKTFPLQPTSDAGLSEPPANPPSSLAAKPDT